MIRVTCPACRSKLNARDDLAGQSRRCPKCGTPVLIAPDSSAEHRPDEEPAPSLVRVDPTAGLRAFRPPARLSRLNHYFICDRTRVIATWQNDGEGWMIRGEFGFVSAHRNQDKLPNQGDFKLVEIQMRVEEQRLCLHGLRVYQLAQRWALLNLARGDDALLKAVIGPGCLLREQKHAVRQQIKERFMQHVWEDSRAVLEYLANSDYHSPGPSEASAGTS